MPFNLEEVERLQNQLDALEDQITDQAEEAILRTLRDISDEMKGAIRTLETDDSGRIIASLENIRIVQGLIIGLDPALQNLAEETKDQITGRLAEVTSLTNDLIIAADLPNLENPVSRVDQDILTVFLNLDLARFNGGAQATTQAIANSLFAQLSGLGTFEDMVDRIEQTVVGQQDRAGNPLGRHARTWAMAAVVKFENQFMQNVLPEEEVGGWLYSGPRDGANRDFCAARVNRVFELEKIREDIANNPIGGSAMDQPGGWGCRHRMIPVSHEDLSRQVSKSDGGLNEVRSNNELEEIRKAFKEAQEEVLK